MSKPALFDINKLEAEVDKEMIERMIDEAKAKLIAKRQDIKRAERIVRNLQREYDVLVLEISENA